MTCCQTCDGHGKLKVGWSAVPTSTTKIRVEYDPCPTCTPPPHTFHAKKVAQQIADIQARKGNDT